MEVHPRALLEAFLFAHGDPLPLAQCAAAIGMSEGITQQILEAMAEQMAEDVASGLILIFQAGSWQLVTKPHLASSLAELLPKQEGYRITPTMLETLAIIACRQPLTRADLEILRGVNCDRIVAKLLALELIAECGRRGRMVLYGTTERFLYHFGLQSPGDLLNLLPATPANSLFSGSQ